MTNAWRDLGDYTSLPRLGSLAISPQGRVLVSVAHRNRERTGHRSSWWELDPEGQRPARRLTRSEEGESFGAFTADGDFLFGSKRAVPGTDEAKPDEDDGVVWLLPVEGGEAHPVARRSGGFSGVVAATGSRTVIVRTPAHIGAADDEADAAKRKARRERKVTAILHDSYPVRYWDHDLGPVADRLAVLDLDGGCEPLTGDVGRALEETTLSLSADGQRLAAGWASPRGVAEVALSVAVIDVATGQHRMVASDDADEFTGPVISRDGRLIACVRLTRSTPETAPVKRLWLVGEDGEGRELAPAWDRWGVPAAFSPDAGTLYAVADEDGDVPVFAIEVASGKVRRLTGEGAFTSVRITEDGRRLYAVRSSYQDPGSVVAIDTATGETTKLPVPVDYPELPGRLERVETTAADGARVPGYLLLPPGDGPAPLALWIHGGPLSSWNSWSWRWCPWLLVSRGWAVLLPDPALSTGYGQDHIQRGWGRWGAEPFTDLMALTDHVVARDDIDQDRTVAMGGSFGGYMANWVAGHTDRFRAIVTHASLWNLDAFGNTTDAAWYWEREMSPEMRERYSPHRAAADIVTPMLVVHGDKDYRVPIGEGLALWRELAAGWAGKPGDFPHRFLYFPDENHWILSPQHAELWYETVLSFIEAGIGKAGFTRPELL